jgi:nucleoside-diphosphate-sugar epimerase
VALVFSEATSGDRLLAQGKRVICLDNLSTGRLANIAQPDARRPV